MDEAVEALAADSSGGDAGAAGRDGGAVSAATLRDLPPQQIEICGEHVSVRVRESRRARTARVRIGAKRPLEIIVPGGTSEAEVASALAARRGWIEQKRAGIQRMAERANRLGLDQAGRICLAGEPLAVERRQEARAVAQLTERACD